MEIEKKCAIELKVEVDADRKCLACEMNQHGARILTPSAGHFPDDSVVHELLHIRRVLLDGIPRIVVCKDYDNWTPGLETALTGLDNSLEHLVIVPEELKCRPKRSSYWEDKASIKLADLPTVNYSDEKDRERWALMTWVFIHHVLNNEVLDQQAWLLIESLGVSGQASILAAVLPALLHSKEKVVLNCFEHLCLPLDIASLEYIDIQNRDIREIPLAQIGASGAS